MLVIDDASPEPDVVALLRSLDPAEWPVPLTVRHHERNAGFVATVNEAFALASGDVVVLNADTVVTAGWLAELVATARSATDVATVTPLTGFGSICTLPEAVRARFGLNGPEPRIDECGAFVAAHSLLLRPEVITGVGFCLYVSRAAIDLVGPLDQATFGTGYGEEVDFCLRASALGLRHLVADAAFVHHRGGGSFGAEVRAERMAAASAILHERYPSFRADNKAERRRDPLAVPFAALELGLTRRRPERPLVLHVLHSPPAMLGGTEQHLMALIAGLLESVDAAILFPVDAGFVLRTAWVGEDGQRVDHELLLPGERNRATTIHDQVAADALTAALELYPFDAVHLQNVIGHSLAPFEVLRTFPGPVVCSVRDLYLACPHHWLLTPDLQPCGLPDDLTVCEQCLPATRDLDRADLEAFRAFVAARVDVVDHWVFASQSACDYLLRAYDLPLDRISIIPHGSLVGGNEAARRIDRSVVLDAPLRLGFVGVGWPKKGLDTSNAVADALVGTGVEIHHYGKLRARSSPATHEHGTYDNRRLAEQLHDDGIQVVFLPAPYAETFGHVLTEAFAAGLPVIGTAYGALGERIREHRAGWTIDPADVDAIVELIGNLDRARDEVLRATEAAHRVPVVTVADTAPRYATLYRPDPSRIVARAEAFPEADPERERELRRRRAEALVDRQIHQRRSCEAAATIPSASPPETDHPIMSSSDVQPHLTRRSDGLVFLVDASGRRKVKSGLLAAALEEHLGPIKTDGDDAYGKASEVATIEILAGPNGIPFVVVGGKRLPVKGLPKVRVVEGAEVDRHPEGPAIDVARANVARSRLSPQASGDLKSELKRIARGLKRRLPGQN